MKAIITKTKIKEKRYNKIYSHTIYKIDVLKKEFYSGYWNIPKLKKYLNKKGYTDVEIFTTPDAKMNY